MCILVGIEFRLYRESISAVLRVLRPHHHTIDIEPERIDAAIDEHQPHLVMCSEVTSKIRRSVPFWILLHPEGQPHGVICHSGQESEISGVNFDHLIAATDRVAETVASSSDHDYCYG